MIYIDKSKHRREGLDVIETYLEEKCKNSNNRYSDIRYDSRDNGTRIPFYSSEKGKYRKKLTRILLENQNRLCCYCLRRLKTAQDERDSDQKITLEHIIPRGFTSGDNVAYYQSAPGLSPDDVELTDCYESIDHVQRKYIHPHKIAYNNLVISCNGTFPDKETSNGGRQKICCNLARRRKEAYPIYFLPHVSKLVVYLKDGDVQAMPNTNEFDLVDTMLTNTELHCDSLKEIRFLWYLLRDENIEDIKQCNTSDSSRSLILSRHLFDRRSNVEIERASELLTKFSKPMYWDTFMLYSIFYGIMKTVS